MSGSRSRFRSLLALALLGLLGLGSVSHAVHDLADTECVREEERGAQPCSMCVGLHAGALAADPDLGVRPTHIVVADVPHVATQRFAAQVDCGGTPRAPPSA